MIVTKSSASAMPHIEAGNLSLVYDTPSGQVCALEDVSFGIEASEFLCIVGPSGCGKSSLLNIIAGFLAPTGGEIRIGGEPVTDAASTAASCSRISPSSSPGARRWETSPSASR
ncbi:MAG TPA: ATP-binding cassette domain-containing protein [Xanthobacteraceae bacterium]